VRPCSPASNLDLFPMPVNTQLCFFCPVPCYGPDSCSLESTEIVFDSRSCAKYLVESRARRAPQHQACSPKKRLPGSPVLELSRDSQPPLSNRGVNPTLRGASLLLFDV